MVLTATFIFVPLVVVFTTIVLWRTSRRLIAVGGGKGLSVSREWLAHHLED